MVIERPVAGRRRGAGKIERAQPRRAGRRADDLDHVGIAALAGLGDLGGERRDIHGGVGERLERGGDIGGFERRQVALHVDDDLGAAARIDLAERLENPVGAGQMIGPGHDGAAAGLIHRRGDFGRVGRDHHRADACGLRPAQDVHNHRHACDFGERLARQSGRGHAGGDQNEDIGHLYEPAVVIRVASCAANRLFVHRPPLPRGALQRWIRSK